MVSNQNNLNAIPDAIVNLYRDCVNNLNLSNNNLRSLYGLALFSNVEELILDNNELTSKDFSLLKPMLLVNTLSANNNHVSTLYKKFNKNWNEIKLLIESVINVLLFHIF